MSMKVEFENSCGVVVPRCYEGGNNRAAYKGDFVELEVQGKQELELLCPVSKLTGFPMSLQESIYMISDKNARLADVLLQEIPPIRSDNSISDYEKMKLLVSRLDSGSFAENDRVAEILGDIAKEFFPQADVEKVTQEAKQTINFVSGDAPEGNA